MQVVAIRDLKAHLSEYVRLAGAGERLLITSNGEVVAELRSPEPEMARRTHGFVRNDPTQYRTYEPALVNTTAQELLDWDRGDR